MDSLYGGDTQWWQKPAAQGGGGQQPPAPAADAAPPADPAPPTETQGVQQARQFVRAELDAAAREYGQRAQQRKAEYQAAERKFVENKELEPWLGVARGIFTQLDHETGQQAPVASLLDATIRQVAIIRASGAQPPKKPTGGFGGTGQSYPIQDEYDVSQTTQQRLRREDPEAKAEAHRKYMLERRLDLELRRDRTTSADEIIRSRVAQAAGSLLDRS